jgi:hypothetical protein
MADITTALQERSLQQTAMTALMHQIKAEDRRYIAVETLGKKNEREALQEASRHLTKATSADITKALKEIECIKGKQYAGTPFYAGIPDTLKQGGITQAELPVWLDACKKTTYCSGNKYQPLPSHDEAWQTYSKIHAEINLKRQAAETLKFRTTPITIIDTDLIQAAEWGFWDDMSANLRRRLFLLLPKKRQQSIRDRELPPEQAMQETRAHYDKMMEIYQ